MKYDLSKIIWKMDGDIKKLQDKVVRMAAIYGAAKACVCYEREKWQESFASATRHNQDVDVQKILRKYELKGDENDDRR